MVSFDRDEIPSHFRNGLREAQSLLYIWLGALMRIPFSFEKIDPRNDTFYIVFTQNRETYIYLYIGTENVCH